MTSQDKDRQIQQLTDRVTAIEEGMMHSEHLLTKLHEVICTVQQRLDEQQSSIDQLLQTTQQLNDRHTEKRTLEDDRPPHY